MTNEEKAKEITEKLKLSSLFTPLVNEKIYDAALQMAEWKDQQFKEYLDTGD